MTLLNAPTPDRAACRLRHRLADPLPVDVITTHYPDADHKILLNVAFPPARSTTRRGRHLAYNRTIAQDARTRFPGSVQCKTAHALAYAAVGHRCTRRLNAPRRPAWQTGQALGLTKAVRIGDREISQRALSNAALRTVTRFCHTADEVITRHHVPCLRGLEDPDLHAQLASHIVPFASKAWADLQPHDDGAVRFDHDHYLKIWALTRPRIQADFLLLRAWGAGHPWGPVACAGQGLQGCAVFGGVGGRSPGLEDQGRGGSFPGVASGEWNQSLTARASSAVSGACMSSSTEGTPSSSEDAAWLPAANRHDHFQTGSRTGCNQVWSSALTTSADSSHW